MLASQVQNQALKAACPVPFDEGRLWKSEDSHLLMLQLQKHFQNMTKAMDCVGCEKCKLWGKLQILGILQSCSFNSFIMRLCYGRVHRAQIAFAFVGKRHDAGVLLQALQHL